MIFQNYYSSFVPHVPPLLCASKIMLPIPLHHQHTNTAHGLNDEVDGSIRKKVVRIRSIESSLVYSIRQSHSQLSTVYYVVLYSADLSIGQICI